MSDKQELRRRDAAVVIRHVRGVASRAKGGKKGAANNLPRCIESVHGIFDEFVVVDTGSVDRTKAIAQELGARVFDFAAARLWAEVLAACPGDREAIAWLDSLPVAMLALE
jgi:hypothetical protein